MLLSTLYNFSLYRYQAQQKTTAKHYFSIVVVHIMGQAGSQYALPKHKLQSVKLLAEGGFGYVELVQEVKHSDDQPPSNKYFALKKIIIQSEERHEAALAEIDILRRTNHLNVISLLDWTITSSSRGADIKEAWMLFPYYRETLFDVYQLFMKHADLPQTPAQNSEGSQLKTSLSNPNSKKKTREKKKWPFTLLEFLKIFLQICEGVQCIHQQNFMHRDIKPHNVMLHHPHKEMAVASAPSSSSQHVKSRSASLPVPVIIDLGSCAPLRTEIHDRTQALAIQDDASFHCTIAYRPPELHDVKSSCVIDGRVDVWMCGCTLYFLAFGNNPFERDDGVSIMAIVGGDLKFPEDHPLPYPTSLLELIRVMLTVDCAKRPTIDQSIEMVKSLIEEVKTGKPSLLSNTSAQPPMQTGENVPTADSADSWPTSWDESAENSNLSNRPKIVKKPSTKKLTKDNIDRSAQPPFPPLFDTNALAAALDSGTPDEVGLSDEEEFGEFTSG
jgi:serine/threonine kinase 16